MAGNTAQRPSFDAGHVPMGEEMGSMRRTLPPVVPVVIAFVVLGIVLAGYLLGTHKPPKYTGSVVKAVVFPVHVESSDTGEAGFREFNTTVEKRDQVVILVRIQLKNESQKPIYIKGISATLPAASGNADEDKEDQAAPAGDYDRIFEAYPALAPERALPIVAETKMEAGAQLEGAEIFSFSMPLEEFQKSKPLAINVNLYDHDPVTLTVQPSQAQVVSAPASGHTKAKARHK